MAVITDCAAGRIYELNLDAHEYREFQSPPLPSKAQLEKQLGRAKKHVGNGSGKTMDTGETSVFLGLTARHMITTTTSKTYRSLVTTRVDGWYVDLPEPGCAPEYLRRQEAVISTVPTGSGFSGISLKQWFGYRMYSAGVWAGSFPFPVGIRQVTAVPYQADAETRLFWNGWLPKGLAVKVSVVERHEPLRDRARVAPAVDENVLKFALAELSHDPIDTSLFEVPPDFKKVDVLCPRVKTTRQVAVSPIQP